MERTDILELMSTLKLYGMRAAYDEVMTTGIKRRHAVTDRRRSTQRRDCREAGALDQVPTDHCQAAAGQGHRGLRLHRHAGQ